LKSRILAATMAATVAVLIAAASASAAPTWAPAASATIHPGVQVFTNGAQCTANFVYYDASNVYLGQAAHCSSTSDNTATNGCDTASLPLGTPVDITGASKPGTLVYNSWIAMHNAGEKDANTCAYNDLALIKIDPADVGKVNPSIPFWGGPTGLATSTSQGETVLSYGNSELRGGVEQLSPKQGKSLGDGAGGWTHEVLTVTPGIPGDSGSAFINETGKAFGILSTLEVAPTPGGNGVGDLSRELGYAASHGASVTLATGTEPFSGPLLPL
jgi:hypothetical protein